MLREWPFHSESVFFKIVRSEKSQNESSPNFSNVCPGFYPGFLSEFFPNFLRIFRASFRGKRRPEKIHQKSPPFFNAKFPGKYGKKIHKMFLERRQSKNWGGSQVSELCAAVSGRLDVGIQSKFLEIMCSQGAGQNVLTGPQVIREN